MTRRIFGLVAALVLLLLLVLAVNTLRQGSRQRDVPPAPVLAVDAQAVGMRLGEAVRLVTIASATDASHNAAQFARLHALLQARYPAAHAVLEREVVSEHSLLYRWTGNQPAALPLLLMAHQDVVPVAPGTEDQWDVAPFSGAIKDGFVWGRGAWDNKGNLIAQLEAVDMLARSGFKPARTIYLAFGADEEVGGQRGAMRIAALLKERGVRLGIVLDEGMLITEGILPGVSAPVAIVGIAEKGFMSLRIRVRAEPGHSSMPPPAGASAIALLGSVVQQVDRNPMPGGIQGIAAQMFGTLAPEMDGVMRVALTNLWLFGPLVERRLEAVAGTNALLRTTTALTMVQAGVAENILPGEAVATVNYRLLPGDTVASVLAHTRAQVGKVMGKQPFDIEVLPGAVEPSPVSSTDSAAYRLVEHSLRSVFPQTLVTPGLLIGGSDSRHFAGIADQTFRFSPVRAKAADLSRFHGSNERIALDNLAELVRFYHQFLTLGAQAS